MTDKSPQELLSCPFCGGEAGIVTYAPERDGVPSAVQCKKCYSTGRTFMSGLNCAGYPFENPHQEAINAWNARPAENTEEVRFTVSALRWEKSMADKISTRFPNSETSRDTLLATIEILRKDIAELEQQKATAGTREALDKDQNQ